MAFPQIASTSSGATGGGSNVTAHVLNLPATVDAGDLLVAVLSLDGTRTVTWPAGWTEILDVVSGASNAADAGAYVAYRIADGSEDGGTVTATSSGSERGAYRVFRISASSWHGTTPPEAASAIVTGSTTFDPPSLSPSWGAEDTTWIAGESSDLGNNGLVSSFPSGYTNTADDAEGSAGGSSLGTCTRELNAASEDPGAFTIGSAVNGIALTIAIRPAAGAGTVDKSGTDTGAGADTASLAAAADVTETGSGADAASLAADAGTVADTGSGSDAVSAGVPVDVTDTGAGADTVAATTEPAPGDETGAGADVGTLAADVPASDAGAGAETAFLSAADQFLPDVGSASEAAIIGLLAAELGLGVDAVSVAVQAPDDWSILIENELGTMVERKERVRPFPSLLIENRSLGGSGTARIPIFDALRELDLEGGRRVRVIHRGVELYEGFVRVLSTADNGWTDGPLLYLLECQDFSTLLEDDVVETAFRSVAESDKARIAWLVSTFGTKGVTAGAEVQQLLAQMPPGEDGRPEQDFSAKTLGEAIDQVLKISGGQKYVDSDKRLHTFKVESVAAPFNLSDVPNGTTTRAYGELVIVDDTIEEKHRVLVVGTGVKLWREVLPLPSSADKVREGVVRDPEITTVEQAEAVGDAYLDRHALRRSGTLVCYEPGLRAQQTIQITHLGMGLVDEPFIIRSVRVQPIADKTEWHVEFGDTAPDLSEVVYDLRQRVTVITGTATQTQSDIVQLQAAGANLIADSSFEASTPAAWEVGTGWTHGFVSANAHRGSKTARLVRSNQAAGILRTADFIPVARVEQYQVSAYSLLSALGAGAQGEIYVEEYNAASTLLATTVIATIAAVETAKTRYSARFGPDAGVGRIAWQATTTKVKVGFRAGGADTTPTITWDVDAVQVERGRLLTAYAPAPEELYNVPGEVVIDESGVTIINGALTVKNPGGTVIIDGTSDMFRIVGTGTLTIAAQTDLAIGQQGDAVAVDSTSNQSIPTNTWTPLNMGHERIDDNGYHTGSQSKLVVPSGAAGYYLIWGAAAWSPSSGGRGLMIALNGDTSGVGRLGMVFETAVVAPEHVQQVAAYRHLSEGDEVELFGYQNSGANLNVVKMNDLSAEFGMTLLRPDVGMKLTLNSVNVVTGLSYAPTILAYIQLSSGVAQPLPYMTIMAAGVTPNHGPISTMTQAQSQAGSGGTNVVLAMRFVFTRAHTPASTTVRYYLMEQVAI